MSNSKLQLASFNKSIKRKKRFNCPLPVSGGELTNDELIAEFWAQFRVGERLLYERRIREYGYGELKRIISEVDRKTKERIKVGELYSSHPYEKQQRIEQLQEMESLRDEKKEEERKVVEAEKKENILLLR